MQTFDSKVLKKISKKIINTPNVEDGFFFLYFSARLVGGHVFPIGNMTIIVLGGFISGRIPAQVCIWMSS